MVPFRYTISRDNHAQVVAIYKDVVTFVSAKESGTPDTLVVVANVPTPQKVFFKDSLKGFNATIIEQGFA